MRPQFSTQTVIEARDDKQLMNKGVTCQESRHDQIGGIRYSSGIIPLPLH
jgi:hypothetical protein